MLLAEVVSLQKHDFLKTKLRNKPSVFNQNSHFNILNIIDNTLEINSYEAYSGNVCVEAGRDLQQRHS